MTASAPRTAHRLRPSSEKTWGDGDNAPFASQTWLRPWREAFGKAPQVIDEFTPEEDNS